MRPCRQYPVKDGLDHDDKDHEQDHVSVEVAVGVAFSLRPVQLVQGQLDPSKPILDGPGLVAYRLQRCLQALSHITVIETGEISNWLSLERLREFYRTKQNH